MASSSLFQVDFKLARENYVFHIRSSRLSFVGFKTILKRVLCEKRVPSITYECRKVCFRDQ